MLEVKKIMVKKTIVLAAAAATGLLLMLEPAWAGYIRCGVHTIQDGGRHGGGMYEVLKKCGEPNERFGNTWIYDRAGTQTVITFSDSGKVAKISPR